MVGYTAALAILIRALRVYQQYRQRHVLDITGVDAMDGTDFEHYVASLLTAQGYDDVKLTERYDLGVDIVANKNGIRWGIQAKRHSGLVKASAVRQVVTALKHYHCDRAIVITNSTYSKVATRLANSNDCILIDRPVLARWIEQSSGRSQEVL